MYLNKIFLDYNPTIPTYKDIRYLITYFYILVTLNYIKMLNDNLTTYYS